ncbi:MAG: hypothetical protein HY512_01295 [Candidatus Aenigmarchaeota archaeon]|nr:hypothetical protein [Candidatus Aenigmarchaeota archaeon]
MDNYLPVSGERRLDSGKLSRFKNKLDKAIQHIPPGQETKRVSLQRKRRMMDSHPREVDMASDFFGISDPAHLPLSEDLLVKLSKLGEFASGLLTPPITPVNFGDQTSVDVYDLQAPNLTNPRENFYLVAFSGIHKHFSGLLEVEPRTGITGPKWTEENKKFYRANSFEEVYQRRERLLKSLQILPFTAEVPENMDLIMDKLLKEDKFSGVKAALDKAIDRIFQHGQCGEDRDRHLMYFLTEVLFFASQQKEGVLSFHFGTDIERAWDVAYSHILIHHKEAFEELCEVADINSKASAGFSGLNYERPSLYPPRGGRERVKPYDPDPLLDPWIPEIGDNETTIKKKLANAPEENLRVLASGLFYTSSGVPDLKDALRNSDLYKRFEYGLGNGVYPHRSGYMHSHDVSKMLAAASDYFGGVL